MNRIPNRIGQRNNSTIQVSDTHGQHVSKTPDNGIALGRNKSPQPVESMNVHAVSIRSLKKYIHLGVTIAVLCIVGAISCSGESDSYIRKKLHAIAKDDLAAITEGIDRDELIEKPYYEVVLYKSFDQGKFTKKAVVEFFFLDKIRVKIVRKYRYVIALGMWERYFNEYRIMHDSSLVQKE